MKRLKFMEIHITGCPKSGVHFFYTFTGFVGDGLASGGGESHYRISQDAAINIM